MEEAIQESCCHGLVTGEDLGPVLDRLVGGDQGGTALVAVADQAKEEARLRPGERLEADLVDDEQRDAFEAIARLKNELDLNVELVSPDQEALKRIEPDLIRYPSPPLRCRSYV